LALALLAAGCGGGPDLKIAEEAVAPDEAATIQRLIEVSKETTKERKEDSETGFGGRQDVKRFNQPRNIGCVRADFSVEPGLPPELAVGLFGSAETYPAWIRFANATDEPDTEKDFRGMSIKVMGVPGPKLLGSGQSQDLVLNSHPVLFVGNAEDFLSFAEKSLSSSPILFFFNPFNPHIKEFRIVMAGRQNHPSHLTIPYWSTTPYLHGEGQAVKYKAQPCNESDLEAPDDPTPGYLQEAMRKQLAYGGACFDFMVQLQTDPKAMPVEDATEEWDESESPFQKVATIEIPQQGFVTKTRMNFCENLAFNPWHTTAEHRPLGGLNRARKDLYSELAAYRHELNGVTYEEPTGAEAF
jgi:hypothetical protein